MVRIQFHTGKNYSQLKEIEHLEEGREGVESSRAHAHIMELTKEFESLRAQVHNLWF